MLVSKIVTWCLFAVVIGGAIAALTLRGRARISTPAPRSSVPSIVAAAGGPSLRFEPNQGQMDPRVHFLARGPGYGLYLMDQSATLALRRPRREKPAPEATHERMKDPRASRGGADSFEQAVVTMHVVGARATTPVGNAALPGATNYFIGANPSKWRTGVEGYTRARYRQVLPGVDLVFYGAAQRQLEYDLVLAPGIDPAGVALSFDGIDSIALDPSGAAILNLHDGGDVRQAPPIAYQEDATGERTLVAAHYRKRPDGALGFVVGAHDKTRPLVIDPALVYSTYLGGHSNDVAYGIATDAAGNAYVTGYTLSSDFPAAGTSLPRGGAKDIFVSKLNADGTTLIYSSYLGGGSEDNANAIAVDSAGNAYITGYTASNDFPMVSAGQPAYGGGYDAFVTKVNAAGNALVYSTYLGGSGYEFAQAIAVDSLGQACITGDTNSANFPKSSPLQGTFGGVRDAFVAKVATAGTGFIYSTYLGGSVDDFGYGIAVDTSSNVYVTGQTFSTNFPTASPFQAVGGVAGFYSDTYVSKITPSGSALVYSTYLGGSGDEIGYGIAVDSSGNAYVAGYTSSANFPIAAPLQATFHGGLSDGFISKFNPAGSAFVYSTYFGGNATDLIYGIALDPSRAAYVTGYTTSTDFPMQVAPAALQPALGGSTDAFVSRVNQTGSALFFSTYLGGAALEYGLDIAVTSQGHVLIAGQTESTNFPTRAPLQASFAGYDDAFVTRIDAVSSVPAGSGWTAVALAAVLLVACALSVKRRKPPRPTIPRWLS